MAIIENVKNILLNVWSILTAVFMALTAVFQGTPAASEGLTLVSEKQFVLEAAFTAGQGIAVDDEFIYTSGAISAVYMGGLAKIDKKTGEFVIKRLDSLPAEFTAKGYDHIGGIGVYDGKIYASVEDKAEETPLVLVYDCATLDYTGVYYNVSNEVLDDGIPWCTVDGDNGYLYCSSFHNATELVAYNIEDMSFSHYIELSEPVDRVQAGSYLDGKVYLNLDPHYDDNSKDIVSVDVATGKVEFISNRQTGGIKTETEGIAAFYNDDGKLSFYITDYDKTVAIFIREYTAG